MKRFVKRIMIFITSIIIPIIVSGIIFLLFLAPQYEYCYNASLLDKIARLKDCPSPKIVLIGNSNLAYGIISEKIENEFGIPVVNLGLHGSLGNAFHENIAKPYINNGDIIIVCHSTYKDDGKISDPKLAWITFENHFFLYNIADKKDYINLTKAFPSYLVKGMWLFISQQGNTKPQDSYSRICFNKYGDNVFPREYDSTLIPANQHCPIIPKINDVCINRLNHFNKFCQERGATLLIGGYPILKPIEGDVDSNYFIEFQQQLQDTLNCTIISDFTDYIFDETLFYNTNLHLTNEGAAIRTEQLIKDLKKYFTHKLPK